MCDTGVDHLFTDRHRDSLFEITQLLHRNAPDLQKTVERTQSLRRSHPQVKVAESIYSQDDRLSVYSARDSMLASSELDFDFDDIVVNSAAYRRVLGAAKQILSTSKHDVPLGDLIDFSDDSTLRQQAVCLPDLKGLGISDDLLGLNFLVSVHQSLIFEFCYVAHRSFVSMLTRQRRQGDNPHLKHYLSHCYLMRATCQQMSARRPSRNKLTAGETLCTVMLSLLLLNH